MNESNPKPSWSLPYQTSSPSDPRRGKRLRAVRIVVYCLLGTALVAPMVQLEYKTIKNHRKALRYKEKLAAATLSAKERLKGPPKPHKGAINRWRTAIRAFWAGENIYQTPEQYLQRKRNETRPVNTDPPTVLHPNIPATVILLTPTAYLPVWAGGLVFTLLKVLVVVAAALAAVRVANHANLRMPDWVAALGAAWWVTLIIGDIQHANTNGFVLGAIVLHLWLYRRGRDLGAGAALVVAVCLKMTPALFVLYWVYQRNWKLLRGVLATGLVVGVVIPAMLLGPGRWSELTGAWYDNLIRPGLLESKWYPIHVNQSLPGVASRYLLDGEPGGNIYWDSDANPYNLQSRFGWIAPVSLSPETVKRIVQIAQAIILLAMGWAIGWRKLPCDDGRRGLHYAMVLTGMLILNQRTWDHHAAILLPGYLAVWYAIAFGRMPRIARNITMIMMILAGLLLWFSAGDLLVAYGKMAGLARKEAKDFADVITAYGPKFFSFLLTFFSAAVLALAMKSSESPYRTAEELA